MGAEPQEATLEGILKQSTIRETLAPHLPKRALGSVTLVSHGMHVAIEPAIETAMEKAALWESQIHSSRDLDLSSKKENRDNQTFKNYVIQRIKDFARENPGIWIKLDLSGNSLGYDAEFLKDLLQAIITTVSSLKSDLASLDLSENKLKILPEHLFAGLNNLQRLDLGINRLTHLPAGLFEGLYYLQELYLSTNRLPSLSEHLFEDLNNLQTLHLDHNLLANLPERLFEGLIHLQELGLDNNRLMGLPERIFGGLNKLQSLDLEVNLLWSLPERLFAGLNDLKLLNLSFNQIAQLPEHLFDGLNNLHKIVLDNNRLNGDSITLLQELRNRKIDVNW